MELGRIYPRLYDAVVEPLHTSGHLPSIFIVVHTCVTVRNGRLTFRVANIGDDDIWLAPRTRVGTVVPNDLASNIQSVSRKSVYTEEAFVTLPTLDKQEIKDLQERDTVIAVLRDNVLKNCHDKLGHQGIERTFCSIRITCYWPGMFRHIKDYCKSCERCIVSKMPQPAIRPAMGHLIANRPLQILANSLLFLNQYTEKKRISYDGYLYNVYSCSTYERSESRHCCECIVV
ncbi:Hypothetical predicted protein [Mytilus galloprovincialis]|uniref:Integrase zinc-binding domain-containing protein n=1 Tax=Mytilus galloprovincialis TaxID=29158 RepID=A0A8B6GPT3_MYTGA|nr:Hypothetical predicted protein [Mytilus galloprovincialis]